MNINDISQLDSDANDELASLFRGLAGAIPFFGGLFGEVICNNIPNQRLGRIVSFLKILSEKLKDMDKDTLKLKIKLESYIDLFEDCIWATTRAITKERKEHIASIFKKGILDEEKEIINHKKVLYLLNQLDDIDLIVLHYYVLLKYDKNSSDDFFNKYTNELETFSLKADASHKEKDINQFSLNHIRHLRQLGLIQTIKGQQTFDDVENSEMKNMEANWMGVILLREIEQLPEDFPNHVK